MNSNLRWPHTTIGNFDILTVKSKTDPLGILFYFSQNCIILYKVMLRTWPYRFVRKMLTIVVSPGPTRLAKRLPLWATRRILDTRYNWATNNFQRLLLLRPFSTPALVRETEIFKIMSVSYICYYYIYMIYHVWHLGQTTCQIRNSSDNDNENENDNTLWF